MTYGGRSTANEGLKPSTHAIVYMASTELTDVAGELGNGMNKQPIAIDRVDHSIQLKPTSRINVSVRHPIHHRTSRAKNLGKGRVEHMPNLIGK